MPSSDMILHINFIIKAVIKEIIVYAIVNTKNSIFPIVNVKIRKTAKNVAATSHGQLSIF